uniref:Metalloendopeptidase n=1 Tax=Strongyloides papillosus TaxID=174720 RepID=A0A0N5CH98_STREA
MKQIFFATIFLSLLILESLTKTYSKELKKPPPYVHSGNISVYVNKNDNRQKVRAILYHLSTRSCLNFNLVAKKISYKSGINIYQTSGHNSLKVSFSKTKPTLLKLRKYIFKNKERLAVYIGRALGMISEITRPDRDKYVTIHWNNIKKSHRHYYQKTKNNYSYYSDVEFDFGSMMLVNPSFGGKNKKSPAYTFKINPNFQKIYDPYYVLSHNDFKFLNGMYCRNYCKNKNDCLNGGYFLRDCQSCECPFHFFGLKCGTPKYSIGDCLKTQKYIADNTVKSFEHKGKTGKCSYHIKSDSNKNITVVLLDIELPNSNCTSSDSYIDVLYRNDRGTTGLTICKSRKSLAFTQLTSEIFIYIQTSKQNSRMHVSYQNDNFKSRVL